MAREKGHARRVVPRLDEDDWDAAPQSAGAGTPAKAGRGRPPSSTAGVAGELVSTTIRLNRQDLDYLDDQALAIRRGSRTFLTRSEVLRGILAAIRSAGLDFSQAVSAQEIEAKMRKKLRP